MTTEGSGQGAGWSRVRVWVVVRCSGTLPSLTSTDSGLLSKTTRVEAEACAGMRRRSVAESVPARTVTGTSATASPSLRTSTATM